MFSRRERKIKGQYGSGRVGKKVCRAMSRAIPLYAKVSLLIAPAEFREQNRLPVV